MRKRGVRVAGILLAVLIAGLATPAIGADVRSYAVTHFGLELDGQPVGILNGFEGGVPYGEVGERTDGQGPIVRKFIKALRYEEITITAPFDMEKRFFQWIQDTVAGKAQGKNGAIITYDYQSNEVARMEFNGGLISEITLPKMDLAAAKTPVSITVKIRPQSTRYVAPRAGKKMDPSKARIHLLPSNFRLRIDGLDKAATDASSIDAVTIKVEIAQNVLGVAPGEAAVYRPVKIRVSNVAVTTRWAKPFYDWSEIFLLRGTGNAAQKNGTLEFINVLTGTKPVLTVTFRNLGVIKVTPVAVSAVVGQAAAASAASAGGVKAEMYCDEIFLAQ